MEEYVKSLAYEKFVKSVDVQKSREVSKTLAGFYDDEMTGFRTSGSCASYKAANYLYHLFKKIGLSNVNMDDFVASGWTFNGANIIFHDVCGQSVKMILGGYATNINIDGEKIRLIYGYNGLKAQLDKIHNINGNWLIIEFDDTLDIKVSYAIYQCYLYGAAGVIVSSKCSEKNKEDLFTEDINCPEFTKALSISKKDFNILKNEILESENKYLEVSLVAKSFVEPFVTSYNVWGEIKGRSDEVVYLIAHYDGYYRAYYNSSYGMSIAVEVMRAIKETGYKPNRTIRIVAHGSKEWGLENNIFDYGIGAFEQITNIHPEWAAKAFTLVDFDGDYKSVSERNINIASSKEILEYVKKIVKSEKNFDRKKVVVNSTDSSYLDEFSYEKQGIFCITANNRKSLNRYNCSRDNIKENYDSKKFEFIHLLFGKIVLELDNNIIRPVDLSKTFEALKDSLVISDKNRELIDEIDNAIMYGSIIKEKIKRFIAWYNDTINSGFKELSDGLRYKGMNVNYDIYLLNKKIQDKFLRLDFQCKKIYPHTISQQNIQLLTKAIIELENEEKAKELVIDNYLSKIDLNKIALYFDKKTYDYFTNKFTFGSKGTWGYRLIEKRNEDLFYICNQIDENENTNKKILKDIDVLKQALKRQEKYYQDALDKELIEIRGMILDLKNIISKFN